MSNRFLRAVLALYPRGFRRRYGPEVQGLVNDLEAAGDRSRLRLVSGLLVSAVAERLRTVRLDARLTISTLVAVAALGTVVGAAGPAATPATALAGPMAPPTAATSSAAGPAGTPATALAGPMAPPTAATSSAAGPAGTPATALAGPMAPPTAATSSAAGPAGTPATALAGPMAPPTAATSSAAGPAGTPATALAGPYGATHGGRVEHQKQNCRCPTEQHSRLPLRTPLLRASTIGADAWATPLDPPGNSEAGGWTIARVRPRRWARASLRSQRSRPSGR